MYFVELLDQICDLLKRQGRVSYWALKRRFDLADDDIEGLKIELVEVQNLAADQDNKMLVWTAGTGPASAPISPPVTDQKPPPLSYTPTYLTEKILTSRSALEGERKQVTVLFADLKDSTELIRDLDPEDAQKLLDPAIHIMMDAVHRFEGTVNQVLGDGIMALFGAPIAHEDHALRACYAALAMQAAMPDHTEAVLRTHGIPLQMRVGLNAGEVVVRTIGNDLHMDYSAVGPTTHLAARMEQLARPGSVMLTAATWRLIEGFVRGKALGPIPVKGMTEPVEVFELTGASTIKRRLQAAVARGLTTFVGRDTEIEALQQALDQARSGHGQVVAAVGEAGVGKSRLVYEFVHSHRTHGWLVLEGAAVSYGKATPYLPVVDLLKRYCHIEEGDDGRTIRAKVTGQIMTLDETLHEAIPALLSLLEALPEESPFRQLEPPQRRQRTLEALKRVLLSESQVQPLLLVFEDLHWIDSETQALLDSLVESLPTAKLLLLVNYRPEYQHDWGRKTYYTQLRLDPLLPESADAFLAALLGDDPSLETLKSLLIERTEGNPFFLEESVRTLVETQVLAGESGAYCLVRELPTIEVPATVQAILAARIDRLPQDEKQLLQTAAVIGTEVPFTLMQAIAELPDEALYRGLTHLQTAEFLYETSLFPERVYTFKHALTHDVAYESLLHERRRVLHARIVEVLESRLGDRVTEQVEYLAYHALRGEVWDKALLYFRQAGNKALEQSVYREAESFFEQALDAVQHMPDSRDTTAQSIDLRCDLRNALIPLGEYDRILDHLRTAESLAETLDDPHRLGQITCYLCADCLTMDDYDQALVAGHRSRTLATSHEDVEILAVANTYLGRIYMARGEYPRAMDLLQQTIDALEGELRYAHFGQLALLSVLAGGFLAWCHADVGTFAEGIAIGEDGVRIAASVDHPFSLAFACYMAGYVALRHGNVAKAIAVLERGLTRCQEAHLPLMSPLVTSFLGSAYALGGRVADALPLLGQTMQQRAESNRIHRILGLELSEAYLLIGRLADAHMLATRTLAFSRERQERNFQARALWLLGEIYTHRDPSEIDQAETHYRQALALADELGMRPLQAHCHHGLGTLYRQTGQAEQARAELSTAIEMYREMEMTFWVPETEAALAEMESRL
jgi:class 3 adenylate cyclase/tetratricopeptide (TPR) repeat protein